MLANLIYDALTMAWSVPPKESDLKGVLIKDINTIEVALNQGPIDPERFDYLMTLPLKDLQRMAEDQSALLDRVRKEQG